VKQHLCLDGPGFQVVVVVFFKTFMWWNSERFVVITKQLQAVKCSLSCQLFRHRFNLLDVDTVVLDVNKRLLDLSALHGVHASRILFLISVSDQLAA
jgi:hypothetical protein